MTASDRAAVARRLRRQGAACSALGAPLYAFLLERLAADADAEAGGPAWAVVGDHGGDAPGSALALRLMGAVHRMALDGTAPGLAAHFPSTGGDGDPGAAWTALAALLPERRDELRAGLQRGVQTNEVGRAAALLGGFLVVAQRTGLPLRTLELGASAGLNLNWDAFSYVGEGRAWGDPASPVRLPYAPPPVAGGAIMVAERAGCDPAPLDPTTVEGRLTLLSYLWPDQVERHARLEGAIALARRRPAPVTRAGAADWLEQCLAPAATGRATVVYHSIVVQYLDPAERTRLTAILAEAGARATVQAPLARLALEPAGDHADVRLTIWPGDAEELLATCGYHGAPVDWLAPPLPGPRTPPPAC